MKRGTKEFYEAQEAFENFLRQYGGIYVSLDFEKDEPPAFYTNGEIDKLFRVFMGGYSLAKSIYETEQ